MVGTGRLIFKVRVDLDDGRSGLIEVREDDNAAELANAFVAEERLPVQAKYILEREIKRQWATYAKVPCIQPERVTQGTTTRTSPTPSDQDGAPWKNRSIPKQAPSPPRSNEETNEQTKRDMYNKLQEKYMGSSKQAKAAIPSVVSNLNSMCISQQQAQRLCDRLHSESVKNRELNKQAQDRARIEKAKKELEACTFKPEITLLARQQPGGRTEGLGLEREIESYQKSRAVRKELHEEYKQRDVSKSCSFKPKICKHSEKIVAEMQQTKDLHHELYLEAERKRIAKQELEHHMRHPFRPNIRESRYNRMKDESEEEFLKRISAPRRKSACLEERQAYDWKTGQRLFHPQVGRPPKDVNKRRPSDLPVSEYLFHLRHGNADLKNELREHEIVAARNEANASSLNPTSQRIAKAIKMDKFSMLWQALNTKEVRADASEELALRCLVELLPETLLRFVGPDAILQAAIKEEGAFVSYLVEACRGVPCTTDLLWA